MKAMVVIGTRPEAIKLAPVVRSLRRVKGFSVRICATAQHRELLDMMLRAFGLRPDIDMGLMRRGQSPIDFLARMLSSVDGVLAREKPGLLLVQGDTTTALGGALAAFHRKIPVGHVEAGLRSFDPHNPFPEEKNRVLIGQIADVHFAPTPAARRNLLREGVDASRIFVTGNTGIDSLLWAARRPHRFRDPILRALAPEERCAVVTLHRRESFGKPLEQVLKGIRDAAELLKEITWVYPVHPNPRVGRAARRLLHHPRVRLTEPLEYLDFVHLMKKAEFLITDSGGIQEEAPSLRKPVIVVREATERPELLGRGGVLVGTDRMRLVRAVLRFAHGKFPPPPSKNPFGDGRAAERIARALQRRFDS